MARKILLVDDSPSELQLMCSALEGKGYDLFTASDGEQAIQQAMQVHPDLVVLDIILPKKNGFQVCRHLKMAQQTCHTKVILISSKNQDTDKYWGLKQGADEYITKPYHPDQLLSSVERYL